MNEAEVRIVTTFDPPPGFYVERVIGLCWGIAVRARSLPALARIAGELFRGGEVRGLTELANDTRTQAMARLVRNATELGANAVVGMRFTSSPLLQNASEVVAYGTAVVIRPRA